MSLRLRRPLLAALYVGLLAAASSAWSQARVIYKVQLPDGRIEFTDQVPRGAKVLETIQPREGNRMQPLARPAPPPQPQPTGPGGQPLPGTPAVSAIDAAMQEVQEAERVLAEARRARDQGREPLEAERQGLKGGGMRTLPTYDERQRALDDAVAAAEERVRRAYEARNIAR
ncbi:MAG: hypothetical protein ING52_05215 [Burkholderiales bacterium]|jgi:hypothetical protein|nr:hypothetical protein [Burkholderiales bacterium]MCA3216014.1 hypothetical protein [Burkholderiales bacterium]MCA3224897.1 hypothetical protein [Burkholderiales bacterium]MCE2645495.1 hypothetical protein [Burkholderiaceae bacterium]